jgi:hypothetical protein
MPSSKLKKAGRIEGPELKRAAKPGKDLQLVYRPIPHNTEWLVFSTPQRAYYVHCISTAIKTAKTWADFIEQLPARERKSLRQGMGDEEPDAKSPFNAEHLPGFSDGDYPPWLQAEMGKHVPATTLEEFGIEENSAINGSYWKVPAENEGPLVKKLIELGFAVSRKDEWHFH